ncbi:MAG: beta-N-acetylhexosaminidase [Pseudomonadota bacterium]
MTNFGATILDADGLRLTENEKRLFADANPFGFILFSRNIDDADQVRALCGDFRDSVGREAPILIDQEGGRVQRLRPPLARNWAPPLDFVAAAGQNAERAMYLRYLLIASELRGLGIDCNCAPLIDLAFADTHEFLRNRCYAAGPDKVAVFGRAVADGLRDGGVLPVMKHMPGHGRAQLDSHHELPRVATDLDTLRKTDFGPFKALADLPMGMTAHIVFEAIADQPATLSRGAIEMIRSEIGFDGLLMTDDIGMKALTGGPGRITVDALNAGCDVVMLCNASFAARVEVAEAAGQMTPQAQARAERALVARDAAPDIDITARTAELEALFRG